MNIKAIVVGVCLVFTLNTVAGARTTRTNNNTGRALVGAVAAAVIIDALVNKDDGYNRHNRRPVNNRYTIVQEAKARLRLDLIKAEQRYNKAVDRAHTKYNKTLQKRYYRR